MGEIERLAMRNAVGDVENDDITQLLQAGEMRERPADHASADQRNLITSHRDFPNGQVLFCAAKKRRPRLLPSG